MPLCPANAHVLPPAITNMENFHCRPDSEQPRREHPNTGHQALPLQLTVNGATSLHDEIEREAVLNYAKANPGSTVAEWKGEPEGWRIIHPPRPAPQGVERGLQHLTFVCAMRRVYRVTHLALSMSDANVYCANHPGESVIDELSNGIVIIAKSHPVGLTDAGQIDDAIRTGARRARQEAGNV